MCSKCVVLCQLVTDHIWYPPVPGKDLVLCIVLQLAITTLFHFSLFVLRFYGPVNPMGSCRARSVYLTTGQALSSKRLTNIVPIPLPETDNCPSWISGRERMTIENISWSISTKECCRPPRGLNPRPPGLQLDGASNWATKAGTPSSIYLTCCNVKTSNTSRSLNFSNNARS